MAVSTYFLNLFPPLTAIPYTCALLAIPYLILGGIYRLYIHPLAKVPGPRIAALTLWYEFYHDFVRKGKYLWVIADMHAKYGKRLRSYCQHP